MGGELAAIDRRSAIGRRDCISVDRNGHCRIVPARAFDVDGFQIDDLAGGQMDRYGIVTGRVRRRRIIKYGRPTIVIVVMARISPSAHLAPSWLSRNDTLVRGNGIFGDIGLSLIVAGHPEPVITIPWRPVEANEPVAEIVALVGRRFKAVEVGGVSRRVV